MDIELVSFSRIDGVIHWQEGPKSATSEMAQDSFSVLTVVASSMWPNALRLCVPMFLTYNALTGRALTTYRALRHLYRFLGNDDHRLTRESYASQRPPSTPCSLLPLALAQPARLPLMRAHTPSPIHALSLPTHAPSHQYHLPTPLPLHPLSNFMMRLNSFRRGSTQALRPRKTRLT